MAEWLERRAHMARAQFHRHAFGNEACSLSRDPAITREAVQISNRDEYQATGVIPM